MAGTASKEELNKLVLKIEELEKRNQELEKKKETLQSEVAEDENKKDEK
jgi:hypothetical protein